MSWAVFAKVDRVMRHDEYLPDLHQGRDPDGSNPRSTGRCHRTGSSRRAARCHSSQRPSGQGTSDHGRQPDATMQRAPQDNQLMSKHCVLSLKPHLRLEWRGQDGQDETEQSDHSASLGDSITSSTRIRFSVHTGSARWCLPEMVKRRFKKSFERWLRGFFVHWHKCEVPTGPEIIRLCPTSALLNYLPSIL